MASIHNTHYSGNKWVEKRDIWNHYWASTTGEVVDDQLIVTCQDSDAAAWLENRGARLIQQALVGQGLGEMEIMFKAERAP